MVDDDLREEAEKRLGTRIDRWRLARLLGVGGMGGVFEGVDAQGGRVAIKVLHRSVSALNNVRARFEDELRVTARINHPGVVRVYGGGIADGDAFLVMELLDGQTVDAVADARGGTLPAEEVLAIAAHTLAALAAAHDAGVVHRDLKPENVFLTRQGTLKVLDFGVARLADERAPAARRTRTGVLMGTPAFMAPEQARGKWSEVDARTDLWAVGAIMFTLLTGRPVHAGETLHELIVAASMRPAPSLARMMQAPLSLVRVVDKALAFEKRERFDDATAMLSAVSAAIPDVLATRARGGAPAGGPAPAAEGPAAPLTAEERAARDGYDLVKATDAERASLSSLFAMLERGMVISAQYGDAHPEAQKRMGAAITDALGAIARSGRPLAWNVTPYGFAAGGHPVWEPAPPLDRIPYHLFMDGVRTIALAPGIEATELLRFLSTISLDRASDMAPEDDLVTQLFEASFEHVAYQAIDTFSEGDQSQRGTFEAKARSVESLARLSLPGHAVMATPSAEVGEYEARILTVLQGGDRPDVESMVAAEQMMSGGRARSDDDVLVVPERALRSLRQRLDEDARRVSPRFLAALSLAWSDGRAADGTAALALPLGAAIDSLLGASPSVAASTTVSMCRAVAAGGEDAAIELADVLAAPARLTAMLGPLTSPDSPDAATFAELLEHLGPAQLPIVLGAADPSLGEATLAAIFEYVVRVGRGHEEQLGELLATAEVDVGLTLIRALVRIGTEPARRAILRASGSRHAVVRIEALAHMEGASSERLRTELKAFIEDADPAVRLAGLRTIRRYAVRAAGPSLVLRARSPRFDSLPLEERSEALDTLAALAPRRAEELCVELLEEGSLLSSEGREQTRMVAATLLGRIGSSDEARAALERVAGARWSTSARVREAAAASQARLSHPPPTRGPKGKP
ncbi:MAG: protein kinase [Myxococcales bacterium]|nr:protein kinase [Myxococcales bacterium]